MELLGRNGRHNLDGLECRESVAQIMEGLTWNVRTQLEPIAHTLEAELPPAAL